jgi:hypothetical protein
MATTRSSSVTLVMFDEVMYQGHGIVRRWMNAVMANFHAYAFEFCPKRTGNLASTIETSVTTTGPRQVDGVIQAGGPQAPYADFVIRGTTGPIMSDKAFGMQAGFRYDLGPGYLMPLPPGGKANGPQYPGGLHYMVSGQTASNFLFRAWAATGRRHRAMAPGSRFPGV